MCALGWRSWVSALPDRSTTIAPAAHGNPGAGHHHDQDLQGHCPPKSQKAPTDKRASLKRLIAWLDKNQADIGAIVLSVGAHSGKNFTGNPNDGDETPAFSVAIEPANLPDDHDGSVSIHVTDRTIGLATRLAHRVITPPNPFGF